MAEVFGVDAELLNDDRDGRALDALAPELDGIVGSIGAKAISRCGTASSKAAPVRSTSVSLNIGAMEALRQMCGGRTFFDGRRLQAAVLQEPVGSDRRQDDVHRAGVEELCECRRARRLRLRGGHPSRLRRRAGPADANRGSGLLSGHRGHLVDERVPQDGPGPGVAQGVVLGQRRRGGQVPGQELARATEDLDALSRRVGGRHYATPAAVTARADHDRHQTTRRCLPRADVALDQTGRPTLAWHFDAEALATEAASDGWYCLFTNLDPATVPAAAVLASVSSAWRCSSSASSNESCGEASPRTSKGPAWGSTATPDVSSSKPRAVSSSTRRPRRVRPKFQNRHHSRPASSGSSASMRSHNDEQPGRNPYGRSCAGRRTS